MEAVKVYLTQACPYCVRAKRFLNENGIKFTEIDLTHNHSELMRLKSETNWQTVPMIFIGSHFIGGYTDMMALHKKGELKILLDEALASEKS